MSDEQGANLPIPHRERNNGGDLEVYHRHYYDPSQWTHPWRGEVAGNDDHSDLGKADSGQQEPPLSLPERRIFNLSISTFILACILLLVIAGLVAVGTLLGIRINQLENRVSELESLDFNRVTLK